MAVLAFFVPVVIFMEGSLLVLFSIAYFFCISYSTISLYRYGVSEDVMRVEEAKGMRSEEMRSDGMRSEKLLLVEEAVSKWTETGSYKEHNLTLSVVARQMNLPRRQLQEWLRHSDYKNLAGLVTMLRIEEAKEILKAHPEWSVESVAEHCGFSSREYFHRAFRQITKMTPAKFQQS